MGGLFSTTQAIKDPVATVGDLPSSESIVGAVRVVLSNFTMYIWDGATWHANGAAPSTPVLDNSTIYYNGSSQIAIKPGGITDDLFSVNSTAIYNWSSTVTYAVGDMVISAECIWMCRVTGTNLTPLLTNTNWKQIANKDSSQNLTFSVYTTANYSFAAGITTVVAENTGSDITLTLPTIASLGGVLGDTTNRVQEFKIYKVGQMNKVTINCGGADTFSDGTTSISLVANGSVSRLFVIFNKTIWFKG